MSERLRIVVLGYIVRGPLGGLAWHHLQYALGLARLGHDVHFVEDSDDHPSCYDPSVDRTGTNPSYGLRFAGRAFDALGLGGRWAYHDAHGRGWLGPAANRVLEACARADVLLNLSGVNPLRPWVAQIPVRALVDTDPVFTQLRHLRDPTALAHARRHTVFFTFGENVGELPSDGLPWQPTRQPIALDAWVASPGPADGRFTTVLQWDSYASVRHNGRQYGMKSDSFAPHVDLPRRCHFVQLELAVGSPSAPRDLLRCNGWALRDSLEVSRDPWTYQRYIRGSKAEFSVAKHGYVAGRSGWFSQRNAACLASGRPVVVQDTGFGTWLPTGAGVVAFASPEQALAGIADVDRRYDLHSRVARALCEDHFDARRVLGRLLDDTDRQSA